MKMKIKEDKIEEINKYYVPETKLEKFDKNEPLSYLNYIVVPTGEQRYVPCFEELQKLNDLRKSKLKSDDLTIIYKIKDTELIIDLVSSNEIINKTIVNINNIDNTYIETIIISESIKLITKEFNRIDSLPTYEIENFKMMRDISNMIINKIIVDWKNDRIKGNFDYYYNHSKYMILNPDISNDYFLFSDLSNLKEYILQHITNWGYIVIDNKIQML